MSSRGGIACAVFFGTASMIAPSSAAPNCETGLARIAKKEAERAIEKNRATACKGLKVRTAGVTAGVDVTERLILRKFELCEDGPRVSLKAEVEIACRTGDQAAFPYKIEDVLSVSVQVDLKRCAVLSADVTGKTTIVRIVEWVTNFKAKSRVEMDKLIRPYCG